MRTYMRFAFTALSPVIANHLLQDPDSLTCRWYHPAIILVIHHACFKGTAIGLKNGELFYPMPLETIALAATAVSSLSATAMFPERSCFLLQLNCTIKEWRKGGFEAKVFSADYEKLYRTHLANLQALEAQSPKTTNDLQREIWHRARSVSFLTDSYPTQLIVFLVSGLTEPPGEDLDVVATLDVTDQEKVIRDAEARAVRRQEAGWEMYNGSD